MRRRVLFHATRPISQRFITIDETVSVGNDINTVTIEGTSNSQQLTFSFGDGNINALIPDTYIANSVVTNNGSEIKNNPGARKVYNWSISITIPKNNTVDTLWRQLIVVDEVGNEGICEIIQDAGNAYFMFNKHNVTLNSDSAEFTFNISSNTSWEID